MVEKWEKDNKETNPFVIMTSGKWFHAFLITGSVLISISAITQHGVRLALAEEEAADLRRDDAITIHDDISPGMLIASGIDLESQQLVFTSLQGYRTVC